jgi:small subunit ribosomal protein S3
MTRHMKRGGKVWIYKGEVAGTRAEREAQQVAARAAAARGRGDRGDRGRGGRPDRRPREDAPVADAATDTAAEPATTGQEG